MKEIVKMYAGSIAYGTNTPTSDVDFRGIFVADPINIRTPFFPIREITDATEEDTKSYELSNFMKLCLDCNPNIIELLWTDQSDIVVDSEAYQLLRSHREDFLSSKVAYTFTGYAYSQLKRISSHSKWINNPREVGAPQQKDFISLLHNFTTEKLFKFPTEILNRDHRLIPYGNHVYGVHDMVGYELYNPITGSLNKEFEGQTHELGYPKFIVKFNESEFKLDHNNWKQYWDWKNNRNEARSQLEEKYNFDTKHGSHLVRLLRMGEEILSGQGVIVKRPDSVELLGIRNGSTTYEEIISYADMMDAKIKQLYETTKLRKKPDIKLAAKVLMKVQDLVWSAK